MSVMPLIAVPEGGDVLDILAARYRTAFDKIKRGRAQWIEGTLELAAVILEARERIPVHREYSRWIEQNGLRDISPQDRSALVQFARDQEAARALLEQSNSTSWQVIWRDRPKCAPSIIRKGALSHRSGSSLRKRRATIPTVMREDYVPGIRERSEPPTRRQRQRAVVQNDPPPARPERKGIILKALTPEQVDPDFVGTPLEFATKYGHVNSQTKQEIEHHKSQEKLMAWLGAVSDFEKAARTFKAEAPDYDTLRRWLTKPGKIEKLDAWLTTIESAWRVIVPCLDLVRSEKKS